MKNVYGRSGRVWLRWVALAMALAMVVAACGDGDPAVDETPTDEDVEDPDAEDPGTDDDAAPSDDNTRAAWTPPELPDDFEPITVPISFAAGPETYMASGWRVMQEKLEEYSDGLITSEIHYAGALVGVVEQIQAIGDGLLPFGTTYPSYAPAPFDVDTWIGEMAFLPVPTPVIGQLQGFAAQLDWSLNTPEVRQPYEDMGIVPLMPDFQIHPNYHLLCDRPVTSLEEASGLTARVAGPAWNEEIESVGLSPIMLPPLEQYEALQRGVINCVAAPLRDMVDLGLLEVGSDLTVDSEANFLGFRFGEGVNQEWWESLPQEAREIIWVAYLDNYMQNVRAAMEADVRAVQAAADEGVGLHEMESDMREALQAHQAETRERLVANPPDQVDDPEAVMSRLEESMDRWLDIVENDLGYGELPDTWQPFYDGEITMADVDLDPWMEALWQEIWLPHMPQ